MSVLLASLPIDHLVEVEATTGCWLFQGFLDRDGYGKWTSPRPNRKCWFVHRLVWTLLRGVIPPGLTLDHLCRRRACCNPDHLEPVTQLVNTLRGRNYIALNAKKTDCSNGHPLSGPNLVIKVRDGRRHRVCRICRNAEALARYHRQAS